MSIYYPAGINEKDKDCRLKFCEKQLCILLKKYRKLEKELERANTTIRVFYNCTIFEMLIFKICHRITILKLNTKNRFKPVPVKDVLNIFNFGKIEKGQFGRLRTIYKNWLFEQNDRKPL